MISEINIYVEGGGPGYPREAIRRGFVQFFSGLRALARQKGIRFNIVAAGTRTKAHEAFCRACLPQSSAFNVLLVDSESAVSASPKEHLCSRDRWDGTFLSDDNCHLMVQAMEAWLIADVPALKRFYGQHFQESALPKNPDVEKIDKDLLMSALNDATRHTKKGKYDKIRDAALLLEQVDPGVVRRKANHCNRLFENLENRISAA